MTTNGRKQLVYVGDGFPTADPVFRLYARPASLRHTIFESGHDYSRPMREAVYGWMTLHLKGEGDGAPVAEPAIATEDPEALRCYPGESRPDVVVAIVGVSDGRRPR